MKCIKFKGSQLWNNLPASLSVLSSHVSFKCKLKEYLIQELDIQYEPRFVLNNPEQFSTVCCLVFVS